MTIHSSKPERNCIVFPPFDVPQTITSKMIHCTLDLPLPPDQEWKTPFIPDNDEISIDRVRSALSHGPFVALAQLDPKYYEGPPSEFTGAIPTHPNIPVFGWTPEKRKTSTTPPYQEIIVCGAKNDEHNNGHVYYLLAREIHTDWPSGITRHEKTADSVYACSIKRFSDSLNNMYPPARINESQSSAMGSHERIARMEWARSEASRIQSLLDLFLPTK